MTEPSPQGTVVLAVGAGIGALVIHTPAGLHRREVEVSPASDPALRTVAPVRPRYVGGGVAWTVVIDDLPQARYVIWRDPVTPLAEIDVPGGTVTEFHWPA